MQFFKKTHFYIGFNYNFIIISRYPILLGNQFPNRHPQQGAGRSAHHDRPHQAVLAAPAVGEAAAGVPWHDAHRAGTGAGKLHPERGPRPRQGKAGGQVAQAVQQDVGVL